MTDHFIIIPYVQFHFRASTIYNVSTRKYYTYKKTKCKTEKNYRHKNSLLLICTEPIVHYVAIRYKSNTLYILFKKIQLFIAEATWTNRVFSVIRSDSSDNESSEEDSLLHYSHCHWSQSVSQTNPKLK